MSNKHISLRLIIMNFLQYAIWGAYLTSMGSFLGKAGLGPQIWLFFATQGFVSIFMPVWSASSPTDGFRRRRHCLFAS